MCVWSAQGNGGKIDGMVS
uniref:Uncharacterized protein n=1 Tax=Rhizophora mucronata TaxID=61149 RepID=A0A2P2R0X2_RHIMU